MELEEFRTITNEIQWFLNDKNRHPLDDDNEFYIEVTVDQYDYEDTPINFKGLLNNCKLSSNSLRLVDDYEDIIFIPASKIVSIKLSKNE